MCLDKKVERVLANELRKKSVADIEYRLFLENNKDGLEMLLNCLKNCSPGRELSNALMIIIRFIPHLELMDLSEIFRLTSPHSRSGNIDVRNSAVNLLRFILPRVSNSRDCELGLLREIGESLTEAVALGVGGTEEYLVKLALENFTCEDQFSGGLKFDNEDI